MAAENNLRYSPENFELGSDESDWNLEFNDANVASENSQQLGYCYLCQSTVSDVSEIALLTNIPQCKHTFHKNCIKDYINEKSKEINAKHVKCPVVKCNIRISLDYALSILDDLEAIFRFECNLYLSKKRYSDQGFFSALDIKVSNCKCTSDKFCKNPDKQLQWKNVVKACSNNKNQQALPT